jgi:formiminoglutamase
MSEDPRLRDFISRSDKNSSKVYLIEFPSDQGAGIKGGRPGASQAPELVRAGLLNLTPHPDFYQLHTNLLEKTYDKGLVPCRGNVKEDHENLGSIVSALLEKNRIPLIIGGGHETSFGHFLGYVNAGKKVSVFNIDAHTGVRSLKDEETHSGSVFRQALEHTSSVCQSYHVFGLNPSAVSFKHYNIVKQRGTALFEKETSKEKVLDQLAKTDHHVMVTMDMDALNQADAPGVSAPNASGMDKELWLQIAFEFGKCPKVSSFDLCEVNPVYDRDNQTVRLAARTIWSFLLGVAQR